MLVSVFLHQPTSSRPPIDMLCVLSTSAPLRARCSLTPPATQTSSRPPIDMLCVLSTSAPLRARFSATSPATQTSSRPSIDMLCVLSISAPLRDRTSKHHPPPNPIATSNANLRVLFNSVPLRARLNITSLPHATPPHWVATSDT